MTCKLDYDSDRIRRQRHAWCGLERAYMQVRLDILLLERR